MRPVLALELSVDGILLHELSYDGKWRQIAAAGLSDPFLPKKMKAMKATAKASQGQWFKNEVWLPREQMFTFEMVPDADEDTDREAEALVALQKNPAIPAGEYVVRLSDEDAKGGVKVVAIEKSVLAETRRFVSGYGFGTDGITVSGKVPGFFNQPYFDGVTAAAPTTASVDFRKIGFFAGLTAATVGLAAGGYWLYSNIEFSPDPATVLEAVENRVFSDEEDPRAPIRPTEVSLVASQNAPLVMEISTTNIAIPDFDGQLDDLTAHVASTNMLSVLDAEIEPERGLPLAAISFWQEAPIRASEGRPDSLPAPESSGFAVAVIPRTDPQLITGDSNIALGTPIASFIAKRPINDFDLAPVGADALPSDESTVVLAALARKLNDNSGFTQVREANAAGVRLERSADLQNVAAVVIDGRPDILPLLRSGADVTEIREPVVIEVVPDVPELTLSQLQNLAAVVIEGSPSALPFLRGGIEIGAEPIVEEPAPEPPIIVAETPRALSLNELQNLAAVVIEGPPPVVPELRAAIEIEAGPVPVVEEPIIVAAAPRELSLDELQNLAAVVVEGSPDQLPELRDGIEIGAEPVIIPEPLPELSLDELQNLAAVVVEGAPALQPELRGGVEIGALPVEEPVVEVPEEPLDETPETEAPSEPVIAEAPPELSVEELQNLAALVVEGRPSILPTLRDGSDLGAGSGVIVEEPSTEEQTEAARLRPVFRPESIVEIAVVNDPDLSDAIVTQAASPLHRSPEFAARVATMLETFAETERTTPRFTEEPREVSLPTSANVAAEATIVNGINLSSTSLIGVYGKPGAYRALIRQKGGVYSMVTIGQSVGGWQIVGIDESTVRIQRGSRTEILRLPG